ncbi:MAG: TIGR03759 family integrating conjugative element protein [Tatlockia sp.]|nr:TIGR03759 family integrating conjugative element protein [Tatlockia sp.]
MLKPFLPAIVLVLVHSAHAGWKIPDIQTQTLSPLANQDSTLAKTGILINEDDITSSQDPNRLILTEQQLHEAKVWELTSEEEKRYVFLMQNRSKIYYEGLKQTPLDILGLNARNEAERNHLAELAARQEAQKVSKNIAWNNAFYKAYNKLFSNVSVVGNFDPAPFSPYAHQPVQLQQGEILYFFIKQEDAVETILMLLQEAIEATPNTTLHLMLLDSDFEAIQLWANKNQISKQLVNSGRITLRAGDLNYQAITIPKKKSPLLLLVRKGQSAIVDLGRF